MSFTRKLDLGGDTPKSKLKPKGKQPKAVVTIGGLTLRQAQLHQKAVIAVSRWTTRLTRAANEVAKHTKTVKRYEKLIAKNAPKGEDQ